MQTNNPSKHNMTLTHIITAATALFAAAFSVGASPVQAGQATELKVLAIGCDFAQDAIVQDLPGFAAADGVNLVIGNVNAHDLKEHVHRAKGNLPEYGYLKIEGGRQQVKDGVRLSDVLADEAWDVITLEQFSEYAPFWDTYEPWLKDMLKYLKKHARKGTRILWHQIWSYENADKHNSFMMDHWNSRGALPMYEGILDATVKVHDNYGLDVIPLGTAIQNLRSGFNMENTVRDGYHLSLTMGRYVAACTWYEALTGKPSKGNSYVPYTLTNYIRRDGAQRAAHFAMEKPFEITSMLSGRGTYGSAEAGYWNRGDESKVPAYTLPDPLVMNDGTPVTTTEQWTNERRPELLELFCEEVYGHSAPRQPGQHYKVIYEDPSAFGGIATRKEVKIFYTDDEDGLYMQLMLYVPNKRNGPVPCFIFMNHKGNIGVAGEPEILDPTEEQLRRYGLYGFPYRGMDYQWFPLSMLMERGYAFATFFKGDVDPDYDDGFQNGIHPYIYKEGQTFPEPNQWGSISAWAWGHSRVLDYLETDPDIDDHKVVPIGHSRGGKTALWTAAQDTRFAMAISNDSGCTGAALSRRRCGQTVRAIQVTFPHWFCRNYEKYMDNEDALPVDQHELIALIAPRPVYVASATLDYGADPRGEFEGLVAAEPVYKLFGSAGLDSHEFPEPQSLVGGDRMGYHLRKGRHKCTYWDWVQYLDFADKYLK